MEQTRLVFTSANAFPQYIDLSAALTMVNGKNFSQFRKDKPLVISGSVRLDAANQKIEAPKNTWVVRNACVKMAAAWRRTLRSAGIRSKRQLNTYGKELRIAFDDDHSQNYGVLGSGTDCPIPDGVANGSAKYYTTAQYDKDGNEYTVYFHAEAGTGVGEVDFTKDFNIKAFENTTAAVPQSGSTDVHDKRLLLLGTTSAATSELPVVYEYIDSRINDADIEDTDMDPTPSADNDMVMMLAPGEEVADDVLDNVDDEGKWRPYMLESHMNPTEVVTAGANVAGQATSFAAPLGLLKWTPAANGDRIVITVSAIGEM